MKLHARPTQQKRDTVNRRMDLDGLFTRSVEKLIADSLSAAERSVIVDPDFTVLITRLAIWRRQVRKSSTAEFFIVRRPVMGVR